ncbi:unnamed protein product [Nezara viridula]|uniref:Uncharacterized protein n=1 Tax=Nezara viridula TaxID=85310 RepID=A0A9P0MMP1_NEZVI|nr:unnamed protein product [Nezara viridula]
MRKARNPKPKLSRKPVYKYPPKTAPAFDSYRPQSAYHAPPALIDSYSPQKTSYKLTAPTYGKPHPAGSPEPPKDKSSEEPPTSYMHVYQGEKATKEGKPTYGYTQSHTTYEDTSKSSPSKTTNHRPVYKPKADTTEEPKQGSFQPPKQTFGFTPYEDSIKESSENYPPSYYKKQPDTVLGPNYFDQNKP